MNKTLNIFFPILLITISAFSLHPFTICAQDVHADTIKPVEKENEDTAQPLNAINFTGTATRNVSYGRNVNFQGSQQELTMDIYKPSNAEGKKFPLVVLIHGGSFKVGDKKHLGSNCEVLADNGYVAVSIDYRLGWGSGAKKACNSDTAQLKQAIYRASQDAHAALRYLAMHANEYSIDKDSVFIGGQSAGAITALFTAYLSQINADTFFPGLQKNLGDLDKNVDGANDDYTLRGILSMWGAFVDPQLITSSNALPTLFFQGEKDRAVAFNSGPFVSCPNATKIYGTYPLYNRLKDLGVSAVAHVDPNGGHGVFSSDFRIANILCFLRNVRAGNKKQIYLTGEQSSCN